MSAGGIANSEVSTAPEKIIAVKKPTEVKIGNPSLFVIPVKTAESPYVLLTSDNLGMTALAAGKESTVKIGRKDAIVDYVIPDASVSRHQATLHLQEGNNFLENHSEINPNRDNQMHVFEAENLPHGKLTVAKDKSLLIDVADPDTPVNIGFDLQGKHYTIGKFKEQFVVIGDQGKTESLFADGENGYKKSLTLGEGERTVIISRLRDPRNLRQEYILVQNGSEPTVLTNNNLPRVAEKTAEQQVGEKENSEINNLGLSVTDATIASAKHPGHNEDRALKLHKSSVYAVFDGLGGHAGGENCSVAASESVALQLLDLQETDPEKVRELLKTVLKNASKAVQQAGPSGGSTASIVVVTEHEGKRYANIAMIGDSTVVLERNGELQSIQKNFINTFVETVSKLKGADALKEERRLELLIDIVTKTKDIEQLSESDKQFLNLAKQANTFISTALGYSYEKIIANEPDAENTHVTTRSIELQDGDKILLYSDGVEKNLSQKQILEHSSDASALVSAAKQTADSGNYWSSRDDITAIVVQVHDKKANNGSKNSESIDQKTTQEILANHAWETKQNLLKKKEKYGDRFDIRGYSTLFDQNGRVEFRLVMGNTDGVDSIVVGGVNDHLEALVFDKKAMIESILSAHEVNGVVTAYFPVSGNVETSDSRHTFVMTEKQAKATLDLCARKLGWNEEQITAAVAAYPVQNESDFAKKLQE